MRNPYRYFSSASESAKAGDKETHYSSSKEIGNPISTPNKYSFSPIFHSLGESQRRPITGRPFFQCLEVGVSDWFRTHIDGYVGILYESPYPCFRKFSVAIPK
jgi:hypothetical protein